MRADVPHALRRHAELHFTIRLTSLPPIHCAPASTVLLLFVVTLNSIVHIFEGREKRRMREAHQAAVQYAAQQKGKAIGAKVIGRFQMAAAKAVHKASRRARGRTPSTAQRGQDPLAASSGPQGMPAGMPPMTLPI